MARKIKVQKSIFYFYSFCEIFQRDSIENAMATCKWTSVESLEILNWSNPMPTNENLDRNYCYYTSMM